MKHLVIDAGPLIGLFYAKDTDHQICKAGFEQLSQAQTQLIVPAPIVFEVYKWLLYRTTPAVAQNTLGVMQQSLHNVPLSQLDLHELCLMVQALPQWQGSLEDASVVLAAQHHRCPLWTLNYRDFGIFKTLELWNPE